MEKKNQEDRVQMEKKLFVDLEPSETGHGLSRMAFPRFLDQDYQVKRGGQPYSGDLLIRDRNGNQWILRLQDGRLADALGEEGERFFAVCGNSHLESWNDGLPSTQVGIATVSAHGGAFQEYWQADGSIRLETVEAIREPRLQMIERALQKGTIKYRLASASELFDSDAELGGASSEDLFQLLGTQLS